MFGTAKFRELNFIQQALVDQPLNARIFLEGPAGCGKTTAAVERMLRLMADGVPANSILLLVPQRTLADPYYQALNYPGVLAGGMVTVLTSGGLAQRMVDLYWPMISAQAGFHHPDETPVFLTLETAQYYMARLVSPLLQEGYFDSVAIERNRLYSQILDNLNKAAVVGFPYTEIGERLKEAWIGEPGQLRVYSDVQECASQFRSFCLQHNLLDYSLQIEVFRDQLWSQGICRSFLQETYRHLFFDNLEEDTPFSHEIVMDWLPTLASALLIYDWNGGYRRFLGADPATASGLRSLCKTKVIFSDSLVMSQSVQALAGGLAQRLSAAYPPDNSADDGILARVAEARATWDAQPLNRQILEALTFEQHHFYPQMLDWIADQVDILVNQKGVSPSEIAILAPYLSDALRFSLMNRLEIRQVPVRSHRPSRALRDELATRCLLTLASLAYPEWRIEITRPDVAYALMQAITGLDLVRAHLLAEIVFRFQDGMPRLSSFDQIKENMQERITYLAGERYERLRNWLAQRREPPDEFDHFLSRLFGELLSQPGFGFHSNYFAGEVTANLVESVQKFRWVAGLTLAQAGRPLGEEYIRMVQAGIIAAQYLRSWVTQPEQAVIIAPAFTFLMSNRPVQVQFWLDAGSRGWSQRLNQPLTHPYVLSRSWQRGRPWSDFDEVLAGQNVLITLALGLLQRCRERVYLGISELGEQGYESRGPLLQALQRILLAVEAK